MMSTGSDRRAAEHVIDDWLRDALLFQASPPHPPIAWQAARNICHQREFFSGLPLAVQEGTVEVISSLAAGRCSSLPERSN
jgi:hypothetical protein